MENHLCWDQAGIKTPRGTVVLKESMVDVVQIVQKALGHAGTTWKELERQQLLQVHQALKDCEVCGQYNSGRGGQRMGGLIIKSTIPWVSVGIDVTGLMGVMGKRG